MFVMEERKLNFNLPLLSVRRSSIPTRSSTPTRSSASIKSINGEKEKKNYNFQLDSRRTIISCKQAYNSDQVTEPVAVPFLWEQIPGRPKDGTALDLQINDRIPCRRESVAELENDGDFDVYSGALSALSPPDSYSVDFSVGGVSGFSNTVVKPSGTYSTDPQTRDFMMSRFLPAAMAMTLEPPPQYASRKLTVSGEQSREIANAVHRDRTRPVVRNESSYNRTYRQDAEEEEESENECDEFSDPCNITAKGCGFLPRLCVKNSLCLLNPVPGIKVRAQTELSLNRDLKKQTKAAFARSQTPAAKKPSRDAISKQKRDNDVSSPRLVGVDNKPTGGYNRFASGTDKHLISRTSPFRRSGCSFNRCDEAKELRNVKANRLNKFNGGYSKSQELIPYNSLRRASSTAEKTLYVDTVNAAGLLRSNSCSSNNKTVFVDAVQKDVRSLFREIAVIKSSFKDVKCLDVPGGDCKPQNEGTQSDNAELSLSSEMSPDNGQAEIMEDLCEESKGLACIKSADECIVDIGSNQIPNGGNTGSRNTSLVPVQLPLPPSLPKTPSESWLLRTLPSVSSQNQSSFLYRRTSFQSKRWDLKASSTTAKWENIVKSSSYLHHDHVRYSEELFPTASQQSAS